MALYRAFATVGGMTAISRILGFVRDMLIAALLGTSAVADAFFVAFRIPNLFRRLFAEGAFDAAFVPLFAKRHHGEGPDAGKAFAEQALAGLTLVLCVLMLLGEIAMPWLMLLLAPGFSADPVKFELAVSYARIALPYLVCMSVVALYSGMLNSLGRFALAAFVPSLLNVVLIAALLICVALGYGGQDSVVGAFLAWGVTISGLAQVAVVVYAGWRAGLHLAFKRPAWNADMKRLLHLAAPGFVAGGIAQLSVIIGTIVASIQDRAVSWLYYADRIFQLPVGVIGVAISVVLLPELSRRLREGDPAAVAESENRSLEFALFLTIPAALALILTADPIMRVLFQHGAFSATDSRASAAMLTALAFGLPAYVLVKVLSPGFFAREDTKTPMICAGHSLAANAVLSILLFVVFGAVGIAMATSIAGWINAVLLALALKHRDGLVLDSVFRRRFRGILAASAMMGLALWGLEELLSPWFWPDKGLLLQVTALVVLVGSGLAVYLGAAELFGAMTVRRFLVNLRAS